MKTNNQQWQDYSEFLPEPPSTLNRTPTVLIDVPESFANEIDHTYAEFIVGHSIETPLDTISRAIEAISQAMAAVRSQRTVSKQFPLLPGLAE